MSFIPYYFKDWMDEHPLLARVQEQLDQSQLGSRGVVRQRVKEEEVEVDPALDLQVARLANAQVEQSVQAIWRVLDEHLDGAAIGL